MPADPELVDALQEARSSHRIAVLIDGDNASAAKLPAIMAELAKWGAATVRRIYGDWTSGRLKGWDDAISEFAYTAVQQHAFVRGKNTTDGRLIIDAMDLLYTAPVDAFCLVSSDSDYAGLAKRLRETGKFVVGVGEKKTPPVFVNACNQFLFTENLAGGKHRATGRATRERRRGNSAADEEDLLELLVEAVEATESEDGWSHLGSIGNYLRNADPSFDPRAWGKPKLIDLLRALPKDFELERSSGRGAHRVRLK